MRVSFGLLLALVPAGAPPSDDPRALATLGKLKADITRDDKLPGRPVIAVNL